MKISGFIAAGLPSIRQHLNIILKLYPEYYSEKNLNNFLLKNCNKFLTSIGTDLERNKEDNSAVFRRFQKRFNRFKNTGFLKDCDMLIDSAGYQFQCGYILKKAVPDFIKGYHDFLIDNYGKYSQAFLHFQHLLLLPNLGEAAVS